MQVEFQFTNETIMSLSKTIAAFPTLEKEKEMPLIRLGHTINNVNLSGLENFLRVCRGKVVVDLNGTDLGGIFERSSHAALIKAQSAKNLSKADRDYLFNL
jgi:hypothetical protein